MYAKLSLALIKRSQAQLGNEANESHFPLPWWEGIKGRGKIAGGS
jgi:hypothetical protein